MKMKTYSIALATVALSVGLPALEVPARSQGTERTHVVLTPEKAVYWIGESVLLRYRIENTGSKSIPIELGGTDSFLSQFRVSAVDSERRAVGVSENFSPFINGTSYIRQIKPGESLTALLPVA